ncbi:hypothetical protein BpHYR1_021040 [Brachionus plicatilis]|uniref:Uncharacterized protein n=1 Tax=Brachionus plicatilis TaxID=10195 RepID=A0A3M7QZK3_BRAPC|nr:hypothetical protein BpHYR1_021040 [Brachionus plicatilis]
MSWVMDSFQLTNDEFRRIFLIHFLSDSLKTIIYYLRDIKLFISSKEISLKYSLKIVYSWSEIYEQLGRIIALNLNDYFRFLWIGVGNRFEDGTGLWNRFEDDTGFENRFEVGIGLVNRFEDGTGLVNWFASLIELFQNIKIGSSFLVLGSVQAIKIKKIETGFLVLVIVFRPLEIF